MNASNNEKNTSLSLFINDNILSYISQKTDRVVSALFLLSGHIPESDPLRWRLREGGLSLLEDVSRLALSYRSPEGDVSSLRADFSRIRSLTYVCHACGYISANNFQLMNSALNELAEFTQNNISSIETRPEPIGAGFFDFGAFPGETAPPESGESAPIKDIKDIHKGHIKDIKDREPLKDKRSIKDTTKTGYDGSTNKERKDKLLRLIKDKGSISVADAAEVITDCSTKTIQRDLLSMVDDGLLKKEGERRWSRYSLV